jgi:hypothetical protein
MHFMLNHCVWLSRVQHTCGSSDTSTVMYALLELQSKQTQTVAGMREGKNMAVCVRLVSNKTASIQPETSLLIKPSEQSAPVQHPEI